MKNFIITSYVQSTKRIQYYVEANSLEKAIEIAKIGDAPYEEIYEDINWETERDFDGRPDKEDEINIPAGTKGVWIKVNSESYKAKCGALVEVTDDYYNGDMINVKWLDDRSNGQMDGGYFVSDFYFGLIGQK